MSRRPLIRVAVAAVLLSACGDGDDVVRPQLDQIAPAIAAVEAELGGPQRFFEVNATPQLVNLFVAIERATRVVPYVYVAGELGSPADATAAEGETFAANAVSFDEDTILDGVSEEVPGSDVELFTIVGGPDGAVRYSAAIRSSGGGTLDVVIGPDGAVQSVDPVG